MLFLSALAEDPARHNIGCDPEDYPTAAYIERYKEAYNNPNIVRTGFDVCGTERPLTKRDADDMGASQWWCSVAQKQTHSKCRCLAVLPCGLALTLSTFSGHMLSIQ